ncbi:HPP family-domain-containing protein [Cokeromyces recurvatus]|uniref:HPP family-domain-containing protein n=1 Tax=Cokeromyces recurvatus TaxID=90255 RepID=UPI00221EFCBC|nr:HPP family-domain-containing protein [Cokeromyces recurvatus]KAI7908160.1 HPP family-domain-containing protein [Cokeromyces recurvatus]
MFYNQDIFEKLPYVVSHFLGYRRIYLWSFIASWIGIAILEIIFTYGPSFKSYQTPMIVASFGASAVLIYGVLDAPLAQPRNVFFGQLIGAIVGVIISQLFLNIKQDWSSKDQYIAVQWIAGAVAMSFSLVIMQMTKTVHPPGGATALIPCVTPSILDIQWFYIGVVALSSLLQICIACLVNNIERRYPQYWWTPQKLPLKIDPTTLTTLMSTHGTIMTTHNEEDIVASNLTTEQEARLSSLSNHREYKNEARSHNNKNRDAIIHHFVTQGKDIFPVVSQPNDTTATTNNNDNSRRSSTTTINMQKNQQDITSTIEQAIYDLRDNSWFTNYYDTRPII